MVPRPSILVPGGVAKRAVGRIKERQRRRSDASIDERFGLPLAAPTKFDWIRISLHPSGDRAGKIAKSGTCPTLTDKSNAGNLVIAFGSGHGVGAILKRDHFL